MLHFSRFLISTASLEQICIGVSIACVYRIYYSSILDSQCLESRSVDLGNTLPVKNTGLKMVK